MQMFQHYTPHGSASPEWLRLMCAMEADCEPLPEPAPIPEILPVVEAA